MHRVVLLGRRPTVSERHLYDVRAEANEIIQKSVKPRKRFYDALIELKAFVEESGCVMTENYIGHGIGLDVHEPPSIGLSTEPKSYSGSGMPRYPPSSRSAWSSLWNWPSKILSWSYLSTVKMTWSSLRPVVNCSQTSLVKCISSCERPFGYSFPKEQRALLIHSSLHKD